MGTVFKAHGQLIVKNRPEVRAAVEELNDYFTDAGGQAVLVFSDIADTIRLEFGIDETGTVHCGDHFESAVEDIRPYIVTGAVFEFENFGEEYERAIDVDDAAEARLISQYKVDCAANTLANLTSDERSAAISKSGK